MTKSIIFLNYIMKDNKLSKEEAIKLHKELNKKAKLAQAYYYNNDPNGLKMTDHEYDLIYDKIIELEEKYNINDPNSVTQTAGIAEKIEKGQEEKHEFPCLSQQKIKHDINKLKEWIGNQAALISNKEDGCCDADTIINTNIGKLKIKDIVDKKLKCKVKTLNHETNTIEFVDILGWFNNSDNTDNKQWYQIQLDNNKIIKLTGNHEIYCSNLEQYKRVDKLDGSENLIFIDELTKLSELDIINEFMQDGKPIKDKINKINSDKNYINYKLFLQNYPYKTILKNYYSKIFYIYIENHKITDNDIFSIFSYTDIEGNCIGINGNRTLDNWINQYPNLVKYLKNRYNSEYFLSYSQVIKHIIAGEDHIHLCRNCNSPLDSPRFFCDRKCQMSCKEFIEEQKIARENSLKNKYGPDIINSFQIPEVIEHNKKYFKEFKKNHPEEYKEMRQRGQQTRKNKNPLDPMNHAKAKETFKLNHNGITINEWKSKEWKCIWKDAKENGIKDPFNQQKGVLKKVAENPNYYKELAAKGLATKLQLRPDDPYNGKKSSETIKEHEKNPNYRKNIELKKKETRLKNGYQTPDKNKSDIRLYYDKVREYTRKSIKKFGDIIWERDCKHSTKGLDRVFFHLDHNYSILQGFIDNIPAEIIGSPVNLRYLPAKENMSKGKKCDITKKQLLEDYEAWRIAYEN